MVASGGFPLPKATAAVAAAAGAPSAAERRKADGQRSLFDVGVKAGTGTTGMRSALQPHALAPELRAAIAAREQHKQQEVAAKAARIEQERAAAAEAKGPTRCKSKPVYVDIFAVAAALTESAQQHTAAAAQARTGFHKHARRGRYGPGGRSGRWPPWMKAAALHHAARAWRTQ